MTTPTPLNLRQRVVDLPSRLVAHLTEDGRPRTARVARITVSTVLAYMASVAVHPETDGITGALTALLIVQVTLSGTLRNGVDRVLSVVSGIVIASVLSSVVGLTWWSLGLAVALSVFTGFMLRLNNNLLEVAISAMLVLSAGANGSLTASGRIVETFIGAAVGVLVNLMFPPGERSQSAGAAVERYADEVAVFLERAADELVKDVSGSQVANWLSQVRKLDERIGQVDSALIHANESRQLNVRALHKRDPGAALRAGLDSVEHSTVALRSIFRGINDVVHFPDSAEDPYPLADRELMAASFVELGHTLRTFGSVVHAQVYGPGDLEEAKLRLALQSLVEVHGRVSEVVRIQDTENTAVHDLNVLLRASIGRIMREVNVEGNGWLARKSEYDEVARHRGVVAVDKLRGISRDLAVKAPGRIRLRKTLP